MAINAAEEETIEALKTWWDENGKQLIVSIVVIVGGYAAWTFWNNSQTETANAASDLYQEILSLAVTTDGLPNAEADPAQVRALADRLQAEFPTFTYAQYASLFAAQQAARQGDLAAAEAYLQWVLDNQQGGLFSEVDEGLVLTANLRLGRVILARGEPERALALVNSVDPKAFEAGFAELRGDIYLAMGRIVDARESYQAARDAGSGSEALRMKLDNLASES